MVIVVALLNIMGGEIKIFGIFKNEAGKYSYVHSGYGKNIFLSGPWLTKQTIIIITFFYSGFKTSWCAR